jgi:LPXTG-motif cell wall-anchored protein
VTRTARLVLLVATLLAVVAAPASAEGEIGVSPDGVHWSSSLGAPLFDPTLRWVPGDTRESSMYVRNQAAQAAEMVVDVVGAEVDSLLETGDLTVSGRVDDGDWRDLAGPGTHRLLDAVAARPGEVLKVDLRVAFAATSVNVSQALSLNLNLRVGLTQAEAGSNDPGTGGTIGEPDDSDAGSGQDDSGSGAIGLLPGTGGPASWVLVTGVALLVTGTIVASRRRKEDELNV